MAKDTGKRKQGKVSAEPPARHCRPGDSGLPRRGENTGPAVVPDACSPDLLWSYKSLDTGRQSLSETEIANLESRVGTTLDRYGYRGRVRVE